MIDVVFHRQRDIVFSIEHARDRRDCAPRDQLANEYNAAPPGISGFLTDVKAQVHFLEIAMQRNWQTEQARIEKQEADDAHERFAIFKIDFSSRRDERRDDLWIEAKRFC